MTPEERAKAISAVLERMRDLRLTEQDLAAKARLDPKTVRAFLSGERWPRARTLQSLCTGLGWPRGEIGPEAPAGGPFDQLSTSQIFNAARELLDVLERRCADRLP